MLISALTLRNIMANNKPYDDNYVLRSIAEGIFTAASDKSYTCRLFIGYVRHDLFNQAVSLLEETGYTVSYKVVETDENAVYIKNFIISWERKLYQYDVVTINPDGEMAEYTEDSFFPPAQPYTDCTGTKIIKFPKAA